MVCGRDVALDSSELRFCGFFFGYDRSSRWVAELDTFPLNQAVDRTDPCGLAALADDLMGPWEQAAEAG